MFDLVADIESYPKFLPLCRALTVRRAQRDVAGWPQAFVADMEVGYKAIRESFTSRVTCDAEKLEILVEYIDGPFRHLENRWLSSPQGERSCIVEFDISYEFKSRALAFLSAACSRRRSANSPRLSSTAPTSSTGARA